MSVAATLDWPRILTPAEVAAIRSVIDLPRLRILFDVMLYSGMRYADLRQVLAEPDRFDEERGTITILTRGKKQRTVVLGDRGREAGMSEPAQQQRTTFARGRAPSGPLGADRSGGGFSLTGPPGIALRAAGRNG